MGDGRGVEGDGVVFPSTWCNWSDDPEILQALLQEFRGTGAGSGVEAGVAEGGGEGEKGAGEKEEGEEDGERSDVHMHLSEVC